MDDERVRLEGIVSALELKINGLDGDNVVAEEAARLRTELDEAYEQIDESALTDDDVDDLMDRLDDLQDILEDLADTDTDWDDEEKEDEEPGEDADDEDD
ncbi:MAG: hypothetical protein ACYDH4_05485 [Candidatus Cryosericum sp.]